jgi:UDP-N-acetylglucosamine diphosphorylase/glucosamine-1-phosphate N-acetyltransferase
MRICHFEDPAVTGLEPLTLTRPGCELLCGLSSLADKQARFFGLPAPGLLVREPLAELLRALRPGIAFNQAEWLAAGPTVMVNARWIPPGGAAPDFDGLCVGLVGDEIAFAVLTKEQLTGCTHENLPEFLDRWRSTLPCREAGGELVARLWELVDRNGTQIEADYHAAAPYETAGRHAAGFALVGPSDGLLIDPTARIDPMVVADTTGGPVVIGAGAAVHAFSRLEGPCYVGAGTHVLGAKVRAGTTLGPNCRVGGEVEASIVQGHSNKYHDGFLGHSYVGEWVNIAAGTQTSDLRNDYGEVVVTVNGRPVPTGRTKVGAFLGDHAKTGLGALLNTGTNAGPFAHLLPAGRLLPRHVPAFTTCSHGNLSDDADPEKLFATAAKVMGRRGREFTAAHATLYWSVYEQTAGVRRQAVRDAEARRLRRGAG